MALSIEKNKYSLTQITLLGIFTLGLILALLLVSHRKKILLSAPLRTPFDGVSVSLPQGNGWHCNLKWKHAVFNNSIAFESRLMAWNKVIGIARWQYMPAPEKITFDEEVEIIKQQTSSVNAENGVIDIDELTVEWASLKPENGVATSYFARCRLPSGRVLKFEVQTPSDSALAEKVFKSSIQTLEYTFDDRLNKGDAFVESFKRAGIAAGLEDETAGKLKRMFLISRRKHSTRADKGTGFIIELFKKSSDSNGDRSINSSSLYFIGGKKGWSGSGLFRCSNHLESFHWQSKQTTLSGQTLSQVELEYSKGIMEQFNLAAKEPWQDKKIYEPSISALPELFLDSLALHYMDYAGGKVLIDIIFPDGRITPAELSPVEADNALARVPTAVYTLKFTIYDGLNSSYELYFDANKHIVAKVEKTRDEIFVLEQTDILTLLSRFRQWQNDINDILKNGYF